MGIKLIHVKCLEEQSERSKSLKCKLWLIAIVLSAVFPHRPSSSLSKITLYFFFTSRLSLSPHIHAELCPALPSLLLLQGSVSKPRLPSFSNSSYLLTSQITALQPTSNLSNPSPKLHDPTRTQRSCCFMKCFHLSLKWLLIFHIFHKTFLFWHYLAQFFLWPNSKWANLVTHTNHTISLTCS